jgi:hypothetical protein
MHFHDAERSHAPSVAVVVAWVIAHALVPLPSHLSVVHVVASAHAAPHFPQLDASSRTHAPAQQKYVPLVGQSAAVLQLLVEPHATVAHTAHANTSDAATKSARFKTAFRRAPSPCTARS